MENQNMSDNLNQHKKEIEIDFEVYKEALENNDFIVFENEQQFKEIVKEATEEEVAKATESILHVLSEEFDFSGADLMIFIGKLTKELQEGE